MADAGSDTINLADTVGYANPAQVRRLFKLVRAEVGDKTGGEHLHNTRGQGLANVVAALDAGVTTLIPRKAASAAVPTRPAPPATLSPKTSSFCSNPWGSTPASTSRG